VEDRAPIDVNKDNFEDVLKGQDLSLDLNVQNTLSDDQDAKLPVHLKIESMKDFSPDSVAKAVPELKAILDLREALKTLKGPLANVPDFRKKIQEIVKDEGAREKIIAALNLEPKK
jgi:type VI secretion system protein ImpB